MSVMELIVVSVACQHLGPTRAMATSRSKRQGNGPKTGSNRAQNTAKILGDFWVFSCFFNVLIGVYGVLIIPKWLKLDS